MYQMWANTMLLSGMERVVVVEVADKTWIQDILSQHTEAHRWLEAFPIHQILGIFTDQSDIQQPVKCVCWLTADDVWHSEELQ